MTSSRPPSSLPPSSPLNTRSLRPRRKGAGRIALFAVILSALVGGATYFVFVRNPHELVAGKIPPKALFALPKKTAPSPANANFGLASSTLASDADTDQFAQPVEQPGDDQASPATVAAAALNLIQIVRQDKSYVSTTAHPALNNDLMTLQRAAQAVAKDDGSDPVVSENLNGEFNYALDAAIARTTIIMDRSTETDLARQTTQQLQALLMQMKKQ